VLLLTRAENLSWAEKLRLAFPLLLIFTIAVLVRVLYNLTAGQGYVALYDAAQYQRIAQHLITEHCYCDLPNNSTVERAPLWPLLIAMINLLTGSDNLHVRLFLSLLGAGTCLILYFFARDLFGRRIALIAGLIGAFSPMLVVYDGWLYSESLYTFLFLLFVYSLYLIQKTGQTRWVVFSGIIAGLGMLTRQNQIITFGMILCWCLLVGGKRLLPARQTVKAGVVITSLLFLLVLPWTLRNYLLTQKIVFVATGGGTILAGAYNDQVLTSTLLGRKGMWVPPIESTADCCNIWGEHANLTPEAFNWITTHPSSVPKLLAYHFINIWWPAVPDGGLPIGQYPGRFASYLIKSALLYIPPLIFLLAVLGTITCWRQKWRELLPVFLGISFTILQCLIFYGSVRFRAPIDPLLILLAAGAFWGLGRRLKKKKQVEQLAENEKSLVGIAN
jgi:4-amino-4-deoxy-L-arabinose transferase-like glycosyltransferase